MEALPRPASHVEPQTLFDVSVYPSIQRFPPAYEWQASSRCGPTARALMVKNWSRRTLSCSDIVYVVKVEAMKGILLSNFSQI